LTRFLHVANGTATTTKFEAAGIPGNTSIWADPLHDGPVPAGLSDDELIELRSTVMQDGPVDPATFVAGLRQWRAVVDRTADYDELILWYEHDLFDQLNLLQLLSRLGASRPWPRAVTKICIGSFPGRPAFKGLGELTPAELGPLFGTRAPVTPAQYDLAAAAWDAFRSPDPTAVEAVIARDSGAMPYLAPALARHLEDLPWTQDGLSRTERRLLSLAAPGQVSLLAAFPRMHDDETAFYITDLSLIHVVKALSAPPRPLLTVHREPGSAPYSLNATIELTADGRAVLGGRADQIALRGIDRWLGGVHLTGMGPHWRWDETARKVVEHISGER
jgi:hypothetical protein